MKPLKASQFVRYFIALWMLLCCFSTYSQATIDTLLASQYYQQADSLLTDRKHDASITLFKKAILLYQKAKAWEKVASCYNRISQNNWRDRKNSKACLENAQNALKICHTYLKAHHKEEAIAYDNIGTYYKINADYDEALNFYFKGLESRKKRYPKATKTLAISYSNIGITYQRKTNYQKALEFQKKGLAISIKNYGMESLITGRDYNDIGNTYSNMGKPDKAIEYLLKDLKITIKNLGKNHIDVGYSYNNLGNVYADICQYEKALNYYKKASLIFNKEAVPYPIFVVYNNIGDLLSDMGEDYKAMEYNKKSLKMALKIYKEKHPHIGICYQNIGISYEKKQEFEKAIEYYNKALNIFNTSSSKNYEDIANIYGNIGNAYVYKKEYDKGLEYHKKAIYIYQNILEKNNSNFPKAYINISNLYLKKGIFDEALSYSKKSLDLLEKLFGEQSPITLQNLNQIATIYAQQDNYDESLMYFNRALSNNLKNDSKNIFDPNQYYNLKYLLETLQGKAKTLQQYYSKNKIISYLEQSIATYTNADILINHIRSSFQNHQDKLAFATQAKEIYQGAIEAQLLLYKATNDPQALEKAFYYTEKSKANTLKELLNDTHAKDYAGLSAELIDLEKTLKTDKAFYQSQLLKEKSNTTIDTANIKTYENELFTINRRQDSLTKSLEINHPNYYQLKYQDSIISVATIQQQLQDHTTLLEYFVADSTTYAFAISKNNITVHELATPDLQSQIDTYRNSITSRDLATYKKQGHQLYQQLIHPIHNNLTGDELIIIPDGPLWHLDFELLLTKADRTNNPQLLSYWLRDYAITYSNAANLLFTRIGNTTRADIPKECLAFSFSDSTNQRTNTMSLATLRGTDDDLPGTRREIKAIADIIDGQYYYGSQAVESNFKKNANRYNILHLALHGEVDHEHPENSRLFFTKSTDTIEDNMLYSHELFALDIPAELTVLSACNTGTGKIAKGEGIMSLGTAFQYAGTKSLLLTRWEVSDQTTPQVMKYFYTYLTSGMSKNKALQQAKLQYLANADINRVHPFYWGGFYLVGDTTPIDFKNPNTLLYWGIGLGVLIVLGGILFWYRRKI